LFEVVEYVEIEYFVLEIYSMVAAILPETSYY